MCHLSTLFTCKEDKHFAKSPTVQNVFTNGWLTEAVDAGKQRTLVTWMGNYNGSVPGETNGHWGQTGGTLCLP